MEADTDLSWDHEGLKPIPKVPKDRLNESPKPPRAPKIPKARVNTAGTFKKEYPAFSGILKRKNTQKFPTKKIKIERKSLQRTNGTLV